MRGSAILLMSGAQAAHLQQVEACMLADEHKAAPSAGSGAYNAASPAVLLLPRHLQAHPLAKVEAIGLGPLVMRTQPNCFELGDWVGFQMPREWHGPAPAFSAHDAWVAHPKGRATTTRALRVPLPPAAQPYTLCETRGR